MAPGFPQNESSERLWGKLQASYDLASEISVTHYHILGNIQLQGVGLHEGMNSGRHGLLEEPLWRLATK